MRGTDFSVEPFGDAGPRNTEQARLDQAMQRADELLFDSLQTDERRRNRRRLWLITLGGLTMFALACYLVLGFAASDDGSVQLVAAKAKAAAADQDASARFAQEGWQLWQSGKPAEAVEKFEKAVELSPKNTAALNGMGWAQFNSGDPKAAEASFKKVIALEPKHPGALNGLGQISFFAHDFPAAEKYLLKAAPQASAAWYALTKLYLLEGKYDQAQKWAKKLVAAGDADETAKQMLAAAEAGSLDEALRNQIEPPQAAKNKSAKSQAKTAEKASEETAKKRVSNPAGRGWQLFSQGRSAEAQEMFAQALEDDPKNGAALNGLGWCLLSSGESAKAKPYFEKCIEANPKAGGAQNGLARVLKAEGDLDGAIKVWEDMVKASPGANAGSLGLAEAYLEKGDHAKALPLLEDLAKAMPDNEQVKAQLEQARGDK